MRVRIGVLGLALASAFATSSAPAVIDSCDMGWAGTGVCAIVAPSRTVDIVIEGVAFGALDTRFEARITDAVTGLTLTRCLATKSTLFGEARCTAGPTRITNAPVAMLCEVRGQIAGLFSCYAIAR